MREPVVNAVAGAAAGMGCSVALARDLVIASESADFLLAFVNIGLAADGGASLLIPERAGFARATEMAMLGERVPATRALGWGLVNRVAAGADLAAEAAGLAQRLANGPTRLSAATRRQLDAWQCARLEAQLELETSRQQEPAGTQDFREGVQAFTAKRQPVFGGR
jgi:2-(1,2-epoxy-1,2-dihydrophenyl)acetyl-CoA isomerase